MSDDLDFLPDINSGFLSGGERRNIVSNLLPAFIDRGYNPSQTISILREYGLGFRESDMRNMYRDVLGFEQDATRIRFVNKQSIPSDNILASANYNFESKYSFIVEATYLGEDGSTANKKFFGYFTDHKSTIGQMEDDAMNHFNERYNVDTGSLLNFRIVKGLINESFEE